MNPINQFNRESESEEDWDKDEDGEFSNGVQLSTQNTRNQSRNSSDPEDDGDAEEQLQENINDDSMACDDDKDKQAASCSKQNTGVEGNLYQQDLYPGQVMDAQQDNNGGQLDTEPAQSNWSSDEDADDDWDVGINSEDEEFEFECENLFIN